MSVGNGEESMVSSGFVSRHFQRLKRRYLKPVYVMLRTWTARTFRSYDSIELEETLREMGLSAGDSLLMHGSFRATNGFQGTPSQIIDIILGIVGPSGHLMMMSMAYSGSSYDYLSEGHVFDVTKAVSRMGIISEIFRHRPGVRRSAHPLHPVLAYGPRADWIVADHENTSYSCGEGTPFEKMLTLDTKVLFYDVGFGVFTFIHYLEHRFKEQAPVKVYREEPLTTTVIDPVRGKLQFKSYVFSPDAIAQRNPGVLQQELAGSDRLIEKKIGNTSLMLVNTRDALRCVQDLVSQGKHFYRF